MTTDTAVNVSRRVVEGKSKSFFHRMTDYLRKLRIYRTRVLEQDNHCRKEKAVVYSPIYIYPQM